MTPIDLGALVVIAARALEEDVPAVLDLMDVTAAEAALAEAALAEAAPAGPASPGSAPAVPADRAADRAAALLSALVRHRPLAHGNERVAVLAAVTFLAVNGWQADLEPAEVTASVVADLAAGRRSAGDVSAWLSPRISGYPASPGQPDTTTPSPAKEAPMMHGWLPSLRRTARHRGDAPFGRYSAQGREVIVSAQQEARALHHNYLGTEHLLLGLLRDRDGVAGRTLHLLGIGVETARAQVLEIIGEGKQEPRGLIPFTPRARKVMELSVREALQTGHLHVGPEHILLGLVRGGDGVAWQVLNRLGATVPAVRDQVRALMQEAQRPAAVTPPGIRDYDTRIELARQAKDAAVDARDLDRAAAARESEKELVAERDGLIARWSAGADVATLGRELDWLRDEVNRLQRLLLEHGIEPEHPLQHPGDPIQRDPGDPTQQSA